VGRETHRRTIGGLRYEHTELPSRARNRVGVLLTQVLAPGATGVGALLGAESLAAGGAAALGASVETLLTRCDPDKVETILNAFAEHTRVALDPAGDRVKKLLEVYDDHFTGDRYADQLDWLVWALEVNFAPLVGRALALYAALGARFATTGASTTPAPAPSESA
jgi:hypothetical protein